MTTPDEVHTTTALCPELWCCADRYRCKRWLDVRLKPNSTFKRETQVITIKNHDLSACVCHVSEGALRGRRGCQAP